MIVNWRPFPARPAPARMASWTIESDGVLDSTKTELHFRRLDLYDVTVDGKASSVATR